MRRFGFLILIVGLLLLFSGCEIVLYRTLEYNISGTSDSLSIRYTDKGGEIVETTAVAPWSTDFDLWSGDRPYLAFIQVTNTGVGDVTVNIVYDEGAVATAVATAGGPAIDLYEIIE